MKTTIIGMAYKSTQYLDFMIQGIREYCSTTDYLIVANDPTDVVLQKLQTDNIKYIVYNDPKPNDYYLNRIYRAWNFGGRIASGEILVFINSDMAFSPGWLVNLLKHLSPETIPCSRLVESGKLLSGEHAISMNFGRSPAEFQKENFLNYVESIKIRQVYPGGLFMPCAFYKDDFVNSGGYPDNITSGDKHFFCNNSIMKVKKHITVFDSIVYHIQEGELNA